MGRWGDHFVRVAGGSGEMGEWGDHFVRVAGGDGRKEKKADN
ncbi:1-phosphofructokinase [Microcystis panniformis FACHB-1757]|uniref:1-phosphofructokinase n=1 Tax=Microcystis panniformis FACHB-1757 TaxID=1638788 RepID=A0A0K1S539_9CHRO|nr:1-phosphofructokinase [Microcystis panniformis FACHB-1757]